MSYNQEKLVDLATLEKSVQRLKDEFQEEIATEGEINEMFNEIFGGGTTAKAR